MSSSVLFIFKLLSCKKFIYLFIYLIFAYAGISLLDAGFLQLWLAGATP